VDGHYVYGHTQDTWDRKEWVNVKSRTRPGANANPSEEYVVGDIKVLHRYIVQIELLHFYRDEGDAALYDLVQAYGQKWQVPVKIDPSVTAGFEDYKVWLKTEARYPQTHKMHPDIGKHFPDYRPTAEEPKPKPQRKKRTGK
jgi:hypothetical protein